MNERTVNRPLDGEEIIEAILAKIRESLRRDCTLAKHLSYPAFKFKAFINIEYQSTGRLTATGVHSAKEIIGPFIEEETVEQETVEAGDDMKPPNQARLEAGLPIPAVATDERGRMQEKKIKYAGVKH